MLVDGGEREEKGAIKDLVEIGDAVEDGYEVGETCDEPDDELSEDSLGDVLARPGEGSVYTVIMLIECKSLLGDLFGKMSDDIWSPYGVGAIQHAEQKHESIAGISSRIGPFTPHKGAGSVHRRH